MIFIDMTSSQHARVLSDLAAVAGTDAPKIAFSAQTGEIVFRSAPTHEPGGHVIANLFADPVLRVTIAGSSGKSVSVLGDPGGPQPAGTAIQPLCATGMYWAHPGKSTGGVKPTTVDIDLVYDPAGVGGPYIGYDPDGNEIPMPGAAQLMFLLTAAVHWYGFSYRSGPDPYAVVVDRDACLAGENRFRLVNFMPERAGALDVYGTACPVQPHKHKTKPPEKKTQGKVYQMPCFVATAAYGSPLDQKVNLLRHFRDDVLMHTRGGSDFCRRFFERYYQMSPAVAARMRADPEFSTLMRQAIVEPLVQWLRLALEMPDARLDSVPSPWREFLEDLHGTMEQWASEMAEPWAIQQLEGLEGARELGIVLRFVMRLPQSRAAYLDDLERRGVIPLRLEHEDVDAARQIFVNSGRTDEEIERVLGVTALIPTVRGGRA